MKNGEEKNIQDLIHKTDEELFALVRHNNEPAFRVLYRRYDKRLFAYCFRALGDKKAAEDVFQTIATTVYEKREHFTGGNFAGWLFTIARNYCLKFKQRQRYNDSIDDVAFGISDESDRTGEDILLKEALRKAIAVLADDFREALEMRYFDGLSYDEIAHALNISVALAKVRVFRAKKMLQAQLLPYIKEPK
jgi:RNA polymerase sigma-70 factor (ECF subfamily)